MPIFIVHQCIGFLCDYACRPLPRAFKEPQTESRELGHIPDIYPARPLKNQSTPPFVRLLAGPDLPTMKALASHYWG